MTRSTLLYAHAAPAGLSAQRPVVRAYGEQDEPERLVVLIADALKEHDRNGLVATCMAKKCGWQDRKEAFAELLIAARGHGPVIIDPDAWYSPGAQQDEPDQRLSDVLAPLELAIDGGGWTLVRTMRERGLPDRLRQLSAEESAEASAVDALSPACQTIARALLERRHLQPDDIEAVFEQVPDPDLHIIRAAYDSLSAEERAVARRLSAWRASSHLNGGYGSFGWGQLKDLSSVPREPVDALRQLGLLQADCAARPDHLVMPRRVRAYVASQAQFLGPKPEGARAGR